MNTLTLVDEYLDALLDGVALEDSIVKCEQRDADLQGQELQAQLPSSTAHGERVAASTEPPRTAALNTVLAQQAPAAFEQAVAEPDVAGSDEHRGLQRPSTSSIATSHRWLRVSVGPDSYALELLRVKEVVRLAPIVALRGAAQAVIGVMNLRGQILPVLDLGLWLEAGCVHPDERSRIVVVERDDEMIGLLVSAVEDIVTLGRERIEPPLASSDPGPVVGIARVGAIPTVLLDANALFG